MLQRKDMPFGRGGRSGKGRRSLTLNHNKKRYRRDRSEYQKEQWERAKRRKQEAAALMRAGRVFLQAANGFMWTRTRIRKSKRARRARRLGGGVHVLPSVEELGVTEITDFLEVVSSSIKKKLYHSRESRTALLKIPWMRSWRPEHILGSYMKLFKSMCGVTNRFNNNTWTVHVPSSRAFCTVFQCDVRMLQCEIPEKSKVPNSRENIRLATRKCKVIKFVLLLSLS